MVAENVQGLPHDSGRVEIMGPLIVLDTLQLIKEESGVIGHTIVWLDSAESLRFANDVIVNILPCKSCARNIDLKKRRRATRKTYEGRVEVNKF